ncbi:unnamed protein product, partial [Oppiella nova]
VATTTTITAATVAAPPATVVDDNTAEDNRAAVALMALKTPALVNTVAPAAKTDGCLSSAGESVCDNTISGHNDRKRKKKSKRHRHRSGAEEVPHKRIHLSLDKESELS